MIGTQGWELGGKIWKSVGHVGKCRKGGKMLAIIVHSWLLMLLTGSSLSFWLNILETEAGSVQWVQMSVALGMMGSTWSPGEATKGGRETTEGRRGRQGSTEAS